ncbi:MAG: glycoside hydrolase family 2, partial [Verrucomicrobiae bacterium]|nr:glycoside hydrolase family 2 [Verrucomicrobiae bacterium]
MKHILSLISFAIISQGLTFGAWSPVKDSMLTEWGEKVTPQNAWREYPRPQMVREDWTNLNGLWDFAITKRGAAEPEKWDGEILVPFAVETPLSGVGKRLEEDEVIWYHREFSLRNPGNSRTLLHFEGVDYSCLVWVNDQAAGSHVGGNLPFAFDVTDLLKRGTNEIVLRIVDDTDSFDRYQLRGKQKRDNSGIWYSPSSGIWQTVWLETVPNTYLKRVKILADMQGKLSVDAEPAGNPGEGLKTRVTVLSNGSVVAKSTALNTNATLVVSPVELWSPANPKLYDLKIELLDADGAVLDSVDSYTG